MATALTVAIDASPLLPPGAAWTTGRTAKGLQSTDSTSIGSRTNGDVPAPGFHSNTVRVDVYDSIRGRKVTAFNTRILRQDAP